MDVLHSEETVLLDQDGKQRLVSHAELSRLHLVAESAVQSPEADEALPRSWIRRICRDEPSRTVDKNRSGERLHSGRNRTGYQNYEGHLVLGISRQLQRPLHF